MRMIDADALIKSAELFEVKAYARGSGRSIVHFAKALLSNEIAKAPTIEAEPVRHGRWERYCDDKFMGYGADGKIKYRKVYTYECDNCRHGTAVKTNYCPNCGAKMDGDSHAV